MDFGKSVLGCRSINKERMYEGLFTNRESGGSSSGPTEEEIERVRRFREEDKKSREQVKRHRKTYQLGGDKERELYRENQKILRFYINKVKN
ncbi:uncharacterized protein OCT59_019646 [Rhizophagus irregularis]|uniref:Uncharacterized protein n=2 Tax=Rhizophagus irregularis TaxID=588596 RepID=A0A915Z566_9GLOM|nr:hypothetical protein OCT59_019646 [Rhizophagus irregularis]GBC51721.1 hypothetical protein RIR_jg26378.t1 [Rhizophagus irregularis DAOM 181602=DAOM 197198]CAB4392285.1 unnamed protein product [Rhizophagus irregularis]CAB4483708.1 unnamed protein product [Rhizophagus irregularis]CAB5209092.1 unnamed protein product [Rhizophagus irregularis]